jgi:hypothetical protein
MKYELEQVVVEAVRRIGPAPVAAYLKSAVRVTGCPIPPEAKSAIAKGLAGLGKAFAGDEH